MKVLFIVFTPQSAQKNKRTPNIYKQCQKAAAKKQFLPAFKQPKNEPTKYEKYT